MARFVTLFVVAGVALGAGCGKTPSPEALCKRLRTLEKKTKAGKKKSAAALKKSHERCVQDMKRLKKKKPKGYKCVARCSKQDDYDAAMACTIGCIMKHTTKKEMKEHSRKAKREMDALCKTDWTGRALHAVTDAVDGVAFSVKIPKGLKREIKKGDGSFPGYVTWREKGGMCGPGFTVQISSFPPTSLDGIKTLMPNKKVVHKKKVPGGYLVSIGEDSKQYLEVTIYRTSKSGKVLKFYMGQRSDKLPKVFDKQRAWLEKVAVTFQAK